MAFKCYSFLLQLPMPKRGCCQASRNSIALAVLLLNALYFRTTGIGWRSSP